MRRVKRVLDLFCCSGGASMGYHRAGFAVEGVDISPQPDYPFTFHLGDAIEFVKEHGREYHLLVGSPPCQRITRLQHYNNTPEKRARYEAKWDDLIAPLRKAMRATGRPYVIENVEMARPDLLDPILLCGHMFGLNMYRHRLFESNMDIVAPAEPKPYHPFLCSRNGYLPTPERPFMSIHGGKHSWAWQRRAAEEMDTPWIGKADFLNGRPAAAAIAAICEAIPPAYTEYIGRQIKGRI